MFLFLQKYIDHIVSIFWIAYQGFSWSAALMLLLVYFGPDWVLVSCLANAILYIISSCGFYFVWGKYKELQELFKEGKLYN